jgi:hypothetical protein
MNLTNVVTTIKEILNLIVPLLVSVGIVYFVWGVVTYVIAGGEEAKKTGKDRIIYGIIGLAVIVSLWGLVNILISTFGLDSAVSPTLTPGVDCNYTSGLLGGNLQHVAGYINCTIKDSIIPFIFAVALATFVWGVVKFFFINSDEEAKRTQGKQFMIWGIVALTVMLSVWGLVSILQETFGITVNTSSGLPKTKE